MLNQEQLQTLNIAHRSLSQEAIQEALVSLGNPSDEIVITSALQLLESSERNNRVLALRILSQYPDEKSKAGILLGLQDEKRRVREVAVKSCKQFLKFKDIVKTLGLMVTNPEEKRKIAAAALNALAGQSDARPMDNLPDTACRALEHFSSAKKYRSQVLFGLLRLDLNEQVEALLRDFVTNGSKEEAVMATRGLCGYKIVNLGEFQDEVTRKEIARNCELAAGRVFYWIKRN